MEHASYFSAIAGNEKIDSETGIIRGVSVITIGQAQGKNAGTWIDQTTLSQIHSVASKFKDGVKVKLSMSKEHDGSVGQIIGVLKNFRTEGNHERADLHLLKSDANFLKIIEMSSAMPSEFGFSVVVPKKMEKVGTRECLRCEDIYSIDLVESPAANPSGLFTSKPMNDIKYAKGNEGEHAKDCECKECMSKHSKKSMSAVAEKLGLSADATEETILAKLTEAIKPPAVAAPVAAPEIAALSARLAAIEQAGTAAILTAKKAEISALVQEATREGKIIPLTDEQLSSMDVAVVKAMFSKLAPNQVSMPGNRKNGLQAPVSADGKPISFKTNDERIEFCRNKRDEGAAMLTAQFQSIASQGLTRN